MVGLHTSWVLIIILTKQIYWEWSRLKVIYFLFLFCEASFRSGKAAEIGAVAMWINKPSRVKFFAVSMFVTFGKDEWRVLIFVVLLFRILFAWLNMWSLLIFLISGIELLFASFNRSLLNSWVNLSRSPTTLAGLL